MWQCPECNRKFININQHHFCGRIETIDHYISVQSVEVQPLLLRMREVIRAAAPEAVEKMAWQMPSFWQHEYLAHFLACKKHIGFYPGIEAIEAFADRIAEYKAAKSTIQLPLDKPIPYDLISEITRWRVASVKEKYE